MLSLIPDRQSDIIRKTILFLGILILLAGMVGGALRVYSRRSRQKDLLGVLAQQGTATIEMLVARKGDQVGGNELTPWAMVRFQGRLYKVPNAIDSEHLHDGQSAQIVYRIGKSGKIYVEQVMPAKIETP